MRMMTNAQRLCHTISTRVAVHCVPVYQDAYFFSDKWPPIYLAKLKLHIQGNVLLFSTLGPNTGQELEGREQGLTITHKAILPPMRSHHIKVPQTPETARTRCPNMGVSGSHFVFKSYQETSKINNHPGQVGCLLQVSQNPKVFCPIVPIICCVLIPPTDRAL